MLPFLLVSTRPEEEALDSEYQAYLSASGLDRENLELAEFDLLGLPPIDSAQYAGVFVAGSPYGAGSPDGYVSPTQRRVQEELRELFTVLLEAGAPIMATGTSMTILAELLGAKITDQYAEYADLIDVELVADAKEDPIFSRLPKVFLAYTNHGDAVGELPEGAVRLARALDTPVQAFRHGDRVYGVQFNPELDAEAIDSQARAFEDSGDTGFGDVEALVAAGRHSEGTHEGAGVISGFVRQFSGD